MKKYSNEEEIINDFEHGKINKGEKYLQLGKLGKNAKYFSDEGLMCMYCDNPYDCYNNWEDYGKEKLKECNKLRKKGVVND